MKASASESVGQSRYVLLMRHASHTDGTLTTGGMADCAEVGRALKDVMSDLSVEPSAETVRVIHASSSEATRTAELIIVELKPGLKAGKEITLDPPKGAMSLDRTALDAIVTSATQCVSHGNHQIVLVVGHLPLLSWVARRVAGRALPIGRAELLGIELSPARAGAKHAGILRWTLTPEARSKELIADIREKIKSKMEAAKYLASFVTAMLGVQIAIMLEPAKVDALQNSAGPSLPRMLAISELFIVLSAALYFLTVFAYDKLLMPPALWADGPPEALRERPEWLVSRPPSSAAWILLQNMQRIWSRLFTWATILLLVGIMLQIFGVFYRRLQWPLATVIIAPLIVCIGFVYVVRQWWPRLGSED